MSIATDSLTIPFLFTLSIENDEDVDSDAESDNEGEEVEELQPDEDVDLMELDAQFKFLYKKHWNHYKSRIMCDHVRAAYMLSPNPIVQKHAKENPDPEDHLAIERLLVKMFVPDYDPGDDESEARKAYVLDKFWDEYGTFQNHTGFFARKSIWISAENEQMMHHTWHERYSYPFTEFFGKLACRVTSKVMGIGEAERHWKSVKKVRVGQRGGRLSAEKAKKQATISAAYSMEKSKLRRKRAATAGKVWTDEDFKTCKLGEKMLFTVALFYTTFPHQLHNVHRYILPW